MNGTSEQLQTPAADQQKAMSGRGPLIISRHGRPKLNRNEGPTLTWQEYVSWWDAYEAGGLDEGQQPPEKLLKQVADANLVLSSERLRAKQTAAMAAPHMAAIPFDLFNEAPLPPPRWPVRFLPRTWNFFARSAWMMGHSLGGETNKEAWVRAGHAAAALHEHAKHGKVYLAAHGWFNRMLRKELRKKGWRCVEDGGNAYWSFRKYEWRD